MHLIIIVFESLSASPFCMSICFTRACAHIYTFVYEFSHCGQLFGVIFIFSYMFFHHCSGECWMEWLLSFLFFSIMIVSCSPIYSCQVFLHAINLPHLCIHPVSFSFFQGCEEP